MRLAVIFSTALILFGCSRDSTQLSPTVPSVPSPPVQIAPQLVNLRGLSLILEVIVSKVRSLKW